MHGPLVMPRKPSEPDQSDFDKLWADFEELREAHFALAKTVEGMQQLFIRIGEYKGKPRGRLPR